MIFFQKITHQTLS